MYALLYYTRVIIMIYIKHVNLEHLNKLHNTYIEHEQIIIRDFYYLPSLLKQKKGLRVTKVQIY